MKPEDYVSLYKNIFLSNGIVIKEVDRSEQFRVIEHGSEELRINDDLTLLLDCGLIDETEEELCQIFVTIISEKAIVPNIRISLYFNMKEGLPFLTNKYSAYFHDGMNTDFHKTISHYEKSYPDIASIIIKNIDLFT